MVELFENTRGVGSELPEVSSELPEVSSELPQVFSELPDAIFEAQSPTGWSYGSAFV